ncbi:glycosyltransferase family 2 protein [Rathayibacter tanaceti]|uniref:Glycosyltransferase n=2 Tax=Rathayibacter tanaceti TaxID=1671680 RepID=A0A166IB31_9MICO|nr:glycosyltransferase family 2 protein [Rathayibacter tanaceti]KZX22075.1 putative glycosyltransferase EpsH [Rathayibacter tanaceti]QHC56588.1 glycosyltransferase [Rathayibacter tanaceti]TCO36810.1 glycosyl transferase family 2 [Rathayibacter tanaceti]
MTLVSVVLPAHQEEAHLAGTLERLLRQTHAELEILVVDDASTDRTAAIGRAFADEHERIHYLRQEENQGVAAARERAVGAATGEWVWLVDADDEWPETAIEVMLAAGEHGRADVVVAQARTVEATGSTPVGSLRGPLALSGRGAFTALLVGELTGHLWNKLFRRELFAGIDFTRIRQHSDQAQVAQLLAAADEVVVIPDSVYEYHLRSGSIIRSGAKRADSLAALAEVIERTARGLDPRVLGSRDYAYYRARFSLLSRFKDATSGAHTPADSRRLWRAAHDEARLRHLLALAGRRDVVRSVLFGLAVAAPPLYRIALRAGNGRR